jgi:uncharacterized protein YodC (DUF2158 family)
MASNDDIRPGDVVSALSTGRRMVVRSVEGEWLRCEWFDGRACREARLRREAVRRLTADARMITLC